jgi:hypothetical protein
MSGQDERFAREEIERLDQVLDCLALTASKLEEILQLLQDPGRVEAMVARYEQFVSGRLPVTVLDSRADGPDDR